MQIKEANNFFNYIRKNLSSLKYKIDNNCIFIFYNRDVEIVDLIREIINQS